MNKKIIMAIIEEDKEIVYENYFFELLKGTSLIDFRNNVNIVQSIRPTHFLEDKVDKYYENLINAYNKETNLFSTYHLLMDKIKAKDLDFFKNYNEFSYLMNKEVINGIIQLFDNNSDLNAFYQFLKQVTNRKISEIVIDALFKDTIYNVHLNIKEMLRYHDSLSEYDRILNDEQISFYQFILGIDKINCDDKIELYNGLKDKNINLMFYQDLRNMKDFSYKKINQSMFDVTEHPEFKDKDLSHKFGIDIYDMRDEEYIMLVSCANKYPDKTTYGIGYYTLLSDKNTSYYDTYPFIYGYHSFPIDHVLHVFEDDAGTPKNAINDSLSSGSKKVNRIMTPEQIIMGNSNYSEINILNKKTDKNDEFIELMKPDFLVAIDCIEEKHIEESKRLNIPIILIKKHILKDTLDDSISYIYNLDDYTNNDTEFIEERRKQNR